MIRRRAQRVLGAEALAGAVMGTCAGILLALVPWMWNTFTSGAPADQTTFVRSLASGIGSVISLFVSWPVWGAAAVTGAMAGTLVGVMIGSIGLRSERADPNLPGGATGVVIGALTGLVLLGSLGTLIAGYGLGLGAGLFIGIFPGGRIGWFIGAVSGEISCKFTGKVYQPQIQRKEEKFQAEQRGAQKIMRDHIDTLVAYFMAKMQEVGSPGLAEPRDDPNGCYFRSYGREGDYSELPWDPKGVWLLPNGLTYACVYPDGRWAYIAPIFNNHTNEVEYYWRAGNGGGEEPALNFPYEPYEATYERAYSLMEQLVRKQLIQYNPGALAGLPLK